jgi:hypothetical protein
MLEIWPDESREIVGKTALALGYVGFLGVCFSGIPITPFFQLGRVVALLGPVAIVLGIVGRYRSTERSSKWAIAIGVLPILYVPTMWFSYFAR